MGEFPEHSVCLAFFKQQLVCRSNVAGPSALPTLAEISQLSGSSLTLLSVANDGDSPIVVCHLAEPLMNHADWAMFDLRAIAMSGDRELFYLAGKGRQVLEWHRNHRFCGRCGQPTRLHDIDRAMECTACGYTVYPRISPCIITLIHREHEILLARSPRFPQGMYSTLAGFVEVGETLEMTLHREVKEEVGVTVKNLQYFASQPWPFPHSLMVGFFAEYSSGPINIDNDEIVDAQWFPLDNLPMIPPAGSIARQLIDHHLSRHPVTEPNP